MAVRIPYDSLTLRAVQQELARSLVGGVIQHIAQPAADELVLTVRNHGANHMLLLSCDANYARAHLTVARRPNPPTPPAFCMLCRKYVEGARIASVQQRGFDRILDIEIVDREGLRFRLIAELMGKHSNLILVSEGGTILDAIKRVTRKISRHRETLPGKPYVAPPTQGERLDPLMARPEEVAAIGHSLPEEPEARAAGLMAHFEGISPFLAQEIVLRESVASLAQVFEEIFGAAHGGQWRPVVVRSERGESVGAYPFQTVQVPAAQQHARDSISTALDHYYSTALPRASADAARRELAGLISRALKSREKQRESALRSLAETARAEEYKQTGELILANLHTVPDQAEAITVTDYYAEGSPERTISLDPSKSAKENAEAYFRRYRKAKDGAVRQQEQLERTERDIAALRDAALRLPDAEDLAAIKKLRTELTSAGLLRADAVEADAPGKQRGPDLQGKKIRTYHTPEGWEIYVGENSEANDFLTGKLAAPNDLWLHVRANASAHVVIRTRNNPAQVPQSVIEQAAMLAARHSPAKHSSLVPVDCTLKKYVRRPKGSASGAALYQNERTIYVSPKE